MVVQKNGYVFSEFLTFDKFAQVFFDRKNMLSQSEKN